MDASTWSNAFIFFSPTLKFYTKISPKNKVGCKLKLYTPLTATLNLSVKLWLSRLVWGAVVFGMPLVERVEQTWFDVA